MCESSVIHKIEFESHMMVKYEVLEKVFILVYKINTTVSKDSWKRHNVNGSKGVFFLGSPIFMFAYIHTARFWVMKTHNGVKIFIIRCF